MMTFTNKMTLIFTFGILASVARGMNVNEPGAMPVHTALDNPVLESPTEKGSEQAPTYADATNDSWVAPVRLRKNRKDESARLELLEHPPSHFEANDIDALQPKTENELQDSPPASATIIPIQRAPSSSEEKYSTDLETEDSKDSIPEGCCGKFKGTLRSSGKLYTNLPRKIQDSYKRSESKSWWITKYIGTPLVWGSMVAALLSPCEPNRVTGRDLPQWQHEVPKYPDTIDYATLDWCDYQLADAEEIKRMLNDHELTHQELADLMNASNRMDGDYSPINDLCELAATQRQDVIPKDARTIDPATFDWCDDQLADAEEIKIMLKINDYELTPQELAYLMNAPNRMDGDYSPINDLCEFANYVRVEQDQPESGEENQAELSGAGSLRPERSARGAPSVGAGMPLEQGAPRGVDCGRAPFSIWNRIFVDEQIPCKR